MRKTVFDTSRHIWKYLMHWWALDQCWPKFCSTAYQCYLTGCIYSTKQRQCITPTYFVASKPQAILLSQYFYKNISHGCEAVNLFFISRLNFTFFYSLRKFDQVCFDSKIYCNKQPFSTGLTNLKFGIFGRLN